MKLGGYIRVSTAREEQATSIENQKRLLQEWASANGHTLVRFYVDVTTGEYAYLRHALADMLEDIRSGVIEGVLCKNLSRSSRDVLDMLALKRQMAESGACLLSVEEGYDSREDDDEFLLVLYAAVAQRESRTTAGRVKITQMMKAREGKTNVPLPGFGYTVEDGKLKPDPKTAPVVRWMVQKYLEGWGLCKIARELNAQGIPTRRGRTWSHSSVRAVLTNPAHLGHTVYNTTTRVRLASGQRKLVLRPEDEWIIVKNTHEPLLSVSEYEAVQAALAARTKTPSDCSFRPKYLGVSILRCGTCGDRLYGQRYRKKSGGWSYCYVCRNRLGKCSATCASWNMEKVDGILLDLLRKIFSNKEKLLDAIKNILGENGDASAEENLQNKLAAIEKAIARQQFAFEQCAIDLEEYRARMAELRAEKEAVAARLAQASAATRARRRLMRVYEEVTAKIDRIEEMPFEEKRRLLTAAFKAVYLGKDYSVVRVVFREA